MEKGNILSKIDDTFLIELDENSLITLNINRVSFKFNKNELIAFDKLLSKVIVEINNLNGSSGKEYRISDDYFDVYKDKNEMFFVKMFNTTISLCGHGFLGLSTLCSQAVIELNKRGLQTIYDRDNPELNSLLKEIYEDIFKEK